MIALFPWAQLQSSASTCGTLELHVLPGVGHRPAEEQPELTAGLIAAWMARAETPAQHYKPNSSASQSRIPAFMVPSLEAGD